MQIIVSSAITSRVMRLRNEFKLACEGSDLITPFSAVLPSVEHKMYSIVPRKVVGMPVQYHIYIDDELVHVVLDFYFNCVQYMAPFMKMMRGFNETLAKTVARLDELLWDEENEFINSLQPDARERRS